MNPRSITRGTAIIEIIVRDLIPKKAVEIISAVAINTMYQGEMPSSADIGFAIMAIPTPNHPICVITIIIEGIIDPFSPNDFFNVSSKFLSYFLDIHANNAP